MALTLFHFLISLFGVQGASVAMPSTYLKRMTVVPFGLGMVIWNNLLSLLVSSMTFTGHVVIA